jgi:hypothetical protein
VASGREPPEFRHYAALSRTWDLKYELQIPDPAPTTTKNLGSGSGLRISSEIPSQGSSLSPNSGDTLPDARKMEDGERDRDANTCERYSVETKCGVTWFLDLNNFVIIAK